MSGVGWRLVDGATRLLDDEERDVVRGDFAELGIAVGPALREVMGLVARRQAAAWADWRPWATCVGFVLPVGALTISAANALGRTYDLYFWIFRNHADIDTAILSDLGLTIHHDVALLITRSLVLACWSWLAGFVLASLSRRTALVNGALLALLLVVGTLPLGLQPYQYDVERGVFPVRFYRTVFPLARLSLFALLPACWGAGQALARRARPLAQAAAWLAAILIALASARGFAPTLRPGVSWPLEMLSLAAYLPLLCMASIAISRRGHRGERLTRG